jgi:hypothetical protein
MNVFTAAILSLPDRPLALNTASTVSWAANSDIPIKNTKITRTDWVNQFDFLIILLCYLAFNSAVNIKKNYILIAKFYHKLKKNDK